MMANIYHDLTQYLELWRPCCADQQWHMHGKCQRSILHTHTHTPHFYSQSPPHLGTIVWSGHWVVHFLKLCRQHLFLWSSFCLCKILLFLILLLANYETGMLSAHPLVLLKNNRKKPLFTRLPKYAHLLKTESTNWNLYRRPLEFHLPFCSPFYNQRGSADVKKKMLPMLPLIWLPCDTFCKKSDCIRFRNTECNTQSLSS